MLSVTEPDGVVGAGVFAGEDVAVAGAGIFVAIGVAGGPGCVVAVTTVVVPGITFCPQLTSNISAILIQMMLIT